MYHLPNHENKKGWSDGISTTGGAVNSGNESAVPFFFSTCLKRRIAALIPGK